MSVLITTVTGFLYGIRRRCATRKFARSMLDFENPAVFEGEDTSKHYGDEEISDEGLQAIIRSFTVERIKFIREVLGGAIEVDSFVDLGDSDGIFLKCFEKEGTSVNISVGALSNIKEKGINGLQADIMQLPIKDNAFDHVFLFQTLEHMPSPIGALKEVSRICRKSAFVSIPYVSKTNIYRHNYDPGRPIFQHHIFEFGERDFRKIITHAGFKVKSRQVVEVFDRGANPLDWAIIGLWNILRDRDFFCGCHERFAIYHLVKEE